ncbi:hypothetical protein H8356DRAFT_1333204 [Neocallimastix lanati (nom. inval.)]|nr:hypothetical protein H8356DRAFT_1333204 [Neocallimastix sp. JGI-2020a]
MDNRTSSLSLKRIRLLIGFFAIPFQCLCRPLLYLKSHISDLLNHHFLIDQALSWLLVRGLADINTRSSSWVDPEAIYICVSL